METNYSVGQHVYIISNNSFDMEMEVMRISGDFYTLRSAENYGSGMRLKKHRLFAMKEETEAVMKNERQKRDLENGGFNRWR